MDDEERNFTDADIQALVLELKAEFFSNIGKGVWGLAWKGMLLIIIGFMIYGYKHT